MTDIEINGLLQGVSRSPHGGYIAPIRYPTPPQPKLAAAFVGFWGAVRNAPKDRKNPHHGNEYATLESVLGAIKGAATKYELAFPQFLGETRDGTITVTTKVIHSSGEEWCFLSSFPLADAGTDKKSGKPRPVGPQQGASASTYLKRYALLAVCGMVGADEEDDDGEAAHDTEGEDTGPEPMTAAELANLRRAIQTFAGAAPGESPEHCLERFKTEFEERVKQSNDQAVADLYVAKRKELRPAKAAGKEPRTAVALKGDKK